MFSLGSGALCNLLLHVRLVLLVIYLFMYLLHRQVPIQVSLKVCIFLFISLHLSLHTFFSPSLSLSPAFTTGHPLPSLSLCLSCPLSLLSFISFSSLFPSLSL